MSSPVDKSDYDCYFFYYSTCNKGDACPFRHCKAALGSEIVCQFWRDGKCVKGQNCKYRHMDLKKPRNKIECFFEKQPGGCKKPHCVFMHTVQPKPSVDIKTEDLSSIPPAVQSLPQDTDISKEATESESQLFGKTHLDPPSIAFAENFAKMQHNSKVSSLLSPPNHNLSSSLSSNEPISFNIDITEESEGEMEHTSLPEKKAKYSFGETNEKNETFGVKTLEQIRMENIFRQTEMELKNKPVFKTESTLSVATCNAASPDGLKADLSEPNSGKISRVRLKRKNPSDSDSPPKLRRSLRNSRNGEKNQGLPFAVKSLDEIRQEKERQKLSQNPQVTTLSSLKSLDLVIDSQTKTTQPEPVKTSPKEIKIAQKPQTLKTVNPASQSVKALPKASPKSLSKANPKVAQQNSQQDNKKTKEIKPASVPQTRVTRLARVRKLQSTLQPGNDQTGKESKPQASDLPNKKRVIKIRRVNPKLRSLPDADVKSDSKKKSQVSNPLDVKSIDNVKEEESLGISISNCEISQKDSEKIEKIEDHHGESNGICTAETAAFNNLNYSENDSRTSENFNESMQFSSSDQLNVQDSNDIHNQSNVHNSMDDQDLVYTESYDFEQRTELEKESFLCPDISQQKDSDSLTDEVDFSELDDSNNKPSEPLAVDDDDEFLREIEQVINS